MSDTTNPAGDEAPNTQPATSTSASVAQVPAQILSAPVAPVTKDGRAKERTLWGRIIRRPELASFLGAVLIFVLFMVVAPPFRTLDAMATVLYASSTMGIMALAVGMLMIGDEFDLSSGVAVTTAALAASMINYNGHFQSWVGVLMSLIIALAIGALNGFLVTRTGIPSFLITLSAFLALQGLNLAITKLVAGAVATPTIADMEGFDVMHTLFASSFTIGGVNIKITIVWWLLFVIIASFMLYQTRFGNWVFAVGGDKNAAHAVGVPVRRVKIYLFMFVGFAAWFVGMHNLFAFDSIQAGQGVGNEFLYIIAAVIGGCALTGGKGTAVGTAIGALIFGMTNQGIVYAGWNPDWFKFFLGAMLLFAVLTNNSVAAMTEKR